MLNCLQRLFKGKAPEREIPDALWQATLTLYPFLAQLPTGQQSRLRLLSSRFLAHKEFHGAQGMVITDNIAVAIAAQACLPVLQLGLAWYDDFVGIVVHPGHMLARREQTDDIGVVHRYSEVLAGEAMEGGPVALSWQDVAEAGHSAGKGYNVVIHEFVHKIDMRDGTADGCPPLPSRAARTLWHDTMQTAYDGFREKVAIAERFGGEPTWLDPYGATSPAEFFAVASEAYFVSRPRFTEDFGPLTALFDQFFLRRPEAVSKTQSS
ncbi:MAG: zinc-dependent peptidase [Polaromonas sp.]|uniref:M90 family metallopeptidase n=1 Tax=Polaromonas sp. TaxID=1869339 RepID=UPI0027334961|nr:M90 family metallopeptidase [Polaromonas sp.]MDP2818302.1 zinc-dependent peptidase [Polaromonas sp.]